MRARWTMLALFTAVVVGMLALGGVASAQVPVDTTPPKVTETNPYDGKTRVRLDKVILAYFSESTEYPGMDRTTIKTSTVRLHQGKYDPATNGCKVRCAVPAEVKYRWTYGKAVLIPNELLKPSTLYTVVVEGASGDRNGAKHAVADWAGNPMTRTYTFTFTTMRQLN